VDYQNKVLPKKSAKSKAQSPLQREIFYLTESTFKELQRMARLNYNMIFPDLMKSQWYSFK